MEIIGCDVGKLSAVMLGYMLSTGGAVGKA